MAVDPMTVEERADMAARDWKRRSRRPMQWRDYAHLRALIQGEIETTMSATTAAVLAEREACAKILDAARQPLLAAAIRGR